MIAESLTTQIEQWSVPTLLFAGLSGLLTAVLFLYRGRELDHSITVSELKARIAALEATVKDLNDHMLECHSERLSMGKELSELRIELYEMRNKPRD